ncbi:MAG: acyl-CoA dehydrogenase family protein [Planctomycetes bacterium]|jgi:butyryl-CoA dehydrogenase|nr:acyl-CoA dehydrogenase family protein [Planctomycetota bacterium]
MDFSLTAEQEAVRETFRRFVDEKIVPKAAEIDRAAEFPREAFRAVGDLGFFGMRYPEEAGGTGQDVVTYCLAVEELARGSLSVAAATTMQSLMGTWFLYRSGDAEIRETLLAPALRGEKIGTICFTEPGAGSDLGAIATRAVRDGDDFVLTGQKTWITSAPVADFFTVWAKTPEKEIAPFLVLARTPGLVVGRAIPKMGVRASVTSEVSFDGVRVPARHRLAPEGRGRAVLEEVLEKIRLMTAALAVGAAQGALDAALRYARERVQFGRPIGEFQAIKLRLADMATGVTAARCLTHYGAWRDDRGLPSRKEAAMAKLFASETGLSVCDGAARVLASYGYSEEYPVERHLRDVRFTLIGGGTSEILKLIIAKELGT